MSCWNRCRICSADGDLLPAVKRQRFFDALEIGTVFRPRKSILRAAGQNLCLQGRIASTRASVISRFPLC